MKVGAMAKIRLLIIPVVGFLGTACASSDKADMSSAQPTCQELEQMRSGLHVDRAFDKIGTPLYAILNAGTNKDPYRPTVEREAEIARLKKERGCP